VLRESRLLAVASVAVAVCACTAMESELPAYAGDTDVYLEPYDDLKLCRLHIALRNTSGERQGYSEFLISWELDGPDLPNTRLRHNAMRPGMLRSASENLPVRCARIESMRIESAIWELFEGWDNDNPQKGRIDGADATDWQFDWNEELGVWSGVRRHN